MEIISKRNQLSQSAQAARIVDLRVWMVRNGLTYAELGRRNRVHRKFSRRLAEPQGA
ncbi:MAG: hypothetical protein LBO64_00210 [Desulfovibrio sp.]|jgi:hypothetical protein|nr:hypothetical protein [Desulfovibrio sp.]